MNINALCKAIANILLADEMPDPSHTSTTLWSTRMVNQFEIDPERQYRSVAVRIWTGHARIIRYYDISTPA